AVPVLAMLVLDLRGCVGRRREGPDAAIGGALVLYWGIVGAVFLRAVPLIALVVVALARQ
ncbi:MAG: hypothetical protein ACJ78T_11840, partial [Myxococcales bacterium]